MSATDLLGHVLDTMPGGMFTVDPRGVITSWNRAMEDVTGYPAAEVLGRSCSILQGNTCFAGPCAEGPDRCPLFAEGRVSGKRCRVRRKDGRMATIVKHARVMRDPDGGVRGAIEVVTDIEAVLELEEEVAELRSQVSGRARFRKLVGRHASMLRLYELIELAGSVTSSVLITGETGTGKELVAEAIHRAGPRRDGPFVRVSCAALSENLLESELFGHVKGAFTGSVSDRVGRFEAANGGTLFLDEIGDVSAAIQTKLLRVLQEREIERVGDSRTIPVDIRIITATNQDLDALCRSGGFRRDLFFRLNVLPITVPPLRERASDIPLLVDHFVGTFNRVLGRNVQGVEPDAMAKLVAYDWPGNVRELESAIEYALVLTRGEELTASALPPGIRENRIRIAPRKMAGPVDAAAVARALRVTGGNRTQAARALGVSRVTLWKWMKDLDLR